MPVEKPAWRRRLQQLLHIQHKTGGQVAVGPQAHQQAVAAQVAAGGLRRMQQRRSDAQGWPSTRVYPRLGSRELGSSLPAVLGVYPPGALCQQRPAHLPARLAWWGLPPAAPLAQPPASPGSTAACRRRAGGRPGSPPAPSAPARSLQSRRSAAALPPWHRLRRLRGWRCTGAAGCGGQGSSAPPAGIRRCCTGTCIRHCGERDLSVRRACI